MLQHLVRVHDVERVVVDVERIHVGHSELHVGSALACPLPLSAASIAAGAASIPTTAPGATRAARSSVIVPAQPTSSMETPEARLRDDVCG